MDSPTRIFNSVLVLVALAGCGASPALPPPSNLAAGTPPTAPDLAELRALLHAQPDAPFDAASRARGCPEDQSFRAYVELLEKSGSPMPDHDEHHLTGGCGAFPTAPIALDPPADAAYWYCRLDAATRDHVSGDPWHYELRLRVRKSDRVLDVATLACPGL